MAVAVVVATRDRREVLLTTLARLASLPDQPQLIVVDNGSSDGTPRAVRGRFPDVSVVALDRNAGAAARNAGVREASTEVVAFSDDDSWWQPGALARAAELFARHPRLAVVAARILVGEDGDGEDPTCAAMARSPVDDDGRPGRAVLGFVACGAVVRRSAFLQVGGFHPRVGIGGEERLLALDLARAGWRLGYVADVVARHAPPPRADAAVRAQALARNGLVTAWLRRRLPGAAQATVLAAARAVRDPQVRAGLAAAGKALPWVVRERDPVPPALERAWALVGEQAEGFRPVSTGKSRGNERRE